jgi:protein PhnA
VYEDGILFICPECAHEWSNDSNHETADTATIRDANGTELKDGDTVTVIKDLKVKGSSSVVKIGTKVKNIRLVDGDHDIDCKVPGIGPMGLKSEFVKKVLD